MRVHRVVVARGAGARCSAFFGGDTGSLMVRSDLLGDAHVNPQAGQYGIFRVGQVDPGKGYVHVLDDENLDILLSELDTVADFVAYLTRREDLVCSDKVVSATGEEDLLAYYLTHTNTDGEHDFVLPPTVDVVEFDHLYQGMREDDQYVAKKSADKMSYVVDQMIEHVSQGAAERTLIRGNELPIRDVEKALRVLAAENRLSRRHLARALVDLLSSASAQGRPKSRCVIRSEASGTGYCLLIYPCPTGSDYDKHRQSRAALLVAYCKVMKFRFPNLHHIVGYATEPLDGERRSEDLMCLDATNWTDDDAQQACKIQREGGILASPTTTHVHQLVLRVHVRAEYSRRQRPPMYTKVSIRLRAMQSSRMRGLCGRHAIDRRTAAPKSGDSRRVGRELADCRRRRASGTQLDGCLGVDIYRPFVHQPTPTLEQIRPRVGRLDLVLDHVSERRLDDLPRVVGLLRRPVPKRGAETVGNGGDLVLLKHLGQRRRRDCCTPGSTPPSSRCGSDTNTSTRPTSTSMPTSP